MLNVKNFENREKHNRETINSILYCLPVFHYEQSPICYVQYILYLYDIICIVTCYVIYNCIKRYIEFLYIKYLFIHTYFDVFICEIYICIFHIKLHIKYKKPPILSFYFHTNVTYSNCKNKSENMLQLEERGENHIYSHHSGKTTFICSMPFPFILNIHT